MTKSGPSPSSTNCNRPESGPSPPRLRRRRPPPPIRRPQALSRRAQGLVPPRHLHRHRRWDHPQPPPYPPHRPLLLTKTKFEKNDDKLQHEIEDEDEACRS
ncbi:transmembrane protein HWLF3 [Striga asiatica]|uniref:Transmembrane protein HWLF3 n=1 Tax=Striga asiatica TaxID=4170 RepID=A0A5A7PPZ6_STRAF|nr:transmembrane protein HWLF3 [Striga asiatica]